MWIIGVLLVLAAGAGLYALILHAVRRYVDRRVSKSQNDLVARHYDEVQNIYQSMRGWRHDYQNHIQTMKAYLAMRRLDELDAYLNQLESDLTTVDTVLKTGNIKLDAILNSKLSLISAKNIRVNAKAQVPAALSVNDVDLCVVVGNLLNNAMEACERIADPEERFIRIYIGVLKQQLYISVINAAPGDIRKLRPGQYSSTKGSGRGFGLKRVDALVARYGGYLSRQSEPGVFSTEVMLPL